MKTRTRLERVPRFVLDELIGLDVSIEQAPNKSLIGLKGKIIDETKETLLVETSKGRRVIPKTGTRLFFPSFGESVQGDALRVRPEERTKKLAKNAK
ncbi:MAG TPA: ribonuclease P protein subunit [Candidatus Norongarragalinales archaeon]|jgi:ribonuclease P protein subunit POP4|nr:ribonuclease P protein subunit [Candidatus Norongarragalinales archaeon]